MKLKESYQISFRKPNIDVFEHYFAVELITQHHMGIKVRQ